VARRLGPLAGRLLAVQLIHQRLRRFLGLLDRRVEFREAVADLLADDLPDRIRRDAPQGRLDAVQLVTDPVDVRLDLLPRAHVLETASFTVTVPVPVYPDSTARKYRPRTLVSTVSAVVAVTAAPRFAQFVLSMLC